MMGTTFPDSITGSHLPPCKGYRIFDAAKSVFKICDIKAGNLEGTLYEGSGAKPCKNPATHYAFRTPMEYAFHLKNAGFDFLSIANNHINDFRWKGLHSTISALRSNGILYAGIRSTCETTEKTIQGIRVGFCAFAHSPNTPNVNDPKEAEYLISELKKRCSIVIVSFHGGAEGSACSRIPFTLERFHDEKRGNVHLFARTCIDAGADLVYGHGPHVPRAIELYKNRLIAYSLGNFCTPYRVSISGKGGMAPLLVVAIRPNGIFLNGKIFSFIQVRGKGPQPDSEQQAAKEIKRLTELDFPSTPLIISEEGDIFRKKQ